jgi:SPP1 family predicted phage head-tail adaptor
MPLAAGKLKHRITIERPHQTQDATTGAINVSWQTLAVVWCAIEPVSVREFIASQSEVSKIKTRIIIRYRNDIDHSMRIYYAPKAIYYNIEGILADKDSGYEYITLACSEGVRFE